MGAIQGHRRFVPLLPREQNLLPAQNLIHRRCLPHSTLRGEIKACPRGARLQAGLCLTPLPECCQVKVRVALAVLNPGLKYLHVWLRLQNCNKIRHSAAILQICRFIYTWKSHWFGSQMSQKMFCFKSSAIFPFACLLFTDCEKCVWSAHFVTPVGSPPKRPMATSDSHVHPTLWQIPTLSTPAGRWGRVCFKNYILDMLIIPTEMRETFPFVSLLFSPFAWQPIGQRVQSGDNVSLFKFRIAFRDEWKKLMTRVHLGAIVQSYADSRAYHIQTEGFENKTLHHIPGR